VNLVRWRAPLPPASSRAFRLDEYLDLYAYTPALRPWPAALARLVDPVWMRWQAGHVADAVTRLGAFASPFATVGVVVAAAALGLARRRPALALAGLGPPAVVLGLALGQPIVFAPHRTLHPYLPLVFLALALLVAELAPLVARLEPKLAGVRAEALLLVLALALLRPSLAPYAPEGNAVIDREQALAAIDARLGGEPVGSDVPCWIIANTASPAVMIPVDGSDAIARMLAHYGLRRLVVSDDLDAMGLSAPALKALRRKGRARVGDRELVVEGGAGPMVVARVVGAGGDPER
jgi:hypothetical protein